MLHISEHGDPSKPALVFLHGFLGSGDDFDGVVKYFEKDHDLILPDLPGHGESPCAYYETAGLSQTFEPPYTFFHELKNRLLEKHSHFLALIGYSMGGRIALILALLFPKHFSALILESTSPGIESENERSARRKLDQKLADKIRSVPTEVFLKEWYAQPLFADLAESPERLSSLIERRAEKLPSSRSLSSLGWANSLESFGPGNQPSFWRHLPSCLLPTLLLAGGRDAKYLAIMREMLKRMQNRPATTRFEMIQGAGHNIHFQRPEDFAESVRRFLGSAT